MSIKNTLLTVTLLLFPQTIIFAGTQCDVISDSNYSFQDEEWQNMAPHSFQDAQAGLIYIRHDLLTLVNESPQSISQTETHAINKKLPKSLKAIQDVLLWQSVTLSKAKLELEIAKQKNGTSNNLKLKEAQDEVENQIERYCAYYGVR